MQVDKGAIKFILSGANVMCPGLTSPGARMTDVQPETVVVSFHYFHLLWPPTGEHGRPLNFAQVSSIFRMPSLEPGVTTRTQLDFATLLK